MVQKEKFSPKKKIIKKLKSTFANGLKMRKALKQNISDIVKSDRHKVCELFLNVQYLYKKLTRK